MLAFYIQKNTSFYCLQLKLESVPDRIVVGYILRLRSRMNDDDIGYVASGNFNLNSNLSESYLESLRSYMTACEVLNALILCATVWILFCMILYGAYTKKWCRRTRNEIYIACFAAIASTLPDAIVILILYNVSEAATQYQCELVMDLTTAFSAFGLLGTYVFLWIRQRAIYNNKYMRAIHGPWTQGISWFLLILVAVCLVSVACVSIMERSIFATPIGCILQHHKGQGNSSINWEGLRAMELCATTLCQIGFLLLFLYPMIHNRKMIRKACAKQKKRHDRVGRVIKRCAICAAIVIISDIATEIWMQFVPPTYPAIVMGTIKTVDLFVDAICILATFDNFTAILVTPCRGKKVITKKEAARPITTDSVDSERRSRVLLDMTESTRKPTLINDFERTEAFDA